jgi:pSer/pThr/pTyr-binding forkhead associated (FHA) protein
MRLRYPKHDGTTGEIELGDKPITVGRSPEADIVVYDEKASRIHCGIRLWDGDFYVKDLKSKNGTFVNGHRVEVASVKPGDEIRIGATVIACVDVMPGANTVLRGLKDEMDGGKGYSTLLREIVHDTGDAQETAPPAAAQPGSEDSSADASTPPALATAGGDEGSPARPAKKKIRLVIKRPPGKGATAS